MKKSFIYLLIILIIGTSTACSNENNKEKAKKIVINYAQAAINAWYYGLNEDCIYENENCKDVAESENHVDFNQLIQTTGFEKDKINEIFMSDVGEISVKTVNNYHNSFINFDTYNEISTYESSTYLNGNKPEITSNEYASVCYNVNMVKYLFEKIYQPELETIYNSNNGNDYADIKYIKEYVDDVISYCLEDNKFSNAFPTSYEAMSKALQQNCNDRLGVQLIIQSIL